MDLWFARDVRAARDRPPQVERDEPATRRFRTRRSVRTQCAADGAQEFRVAAGCVCGTLHLLRAAPSLRYDAQRQRERADARAVLEGFEVARSRQPDSAQTVR